ncbi:MAG: translation elongation factor Ts [bacterium]|nr:translation elongation factor Ts [bacterium]
MAVSLEQIKKLREITGAPIIECRQALEESNNDEKKALEYLKKKGLDKAEKKSSRETKNGWIACYTHTTGKVGVLVEILCETDFVARNEEFQNLGHELCLQVASMKPKDVQELLRQEYVRESSKKVEELIKEVIFKTGENIVVNRFQRFQLGEK